jgi:peptide/nickel transport system substrate-binding protein
MKRVISIALVATLLLVTMSGCGGGQISDTGLIVAQSADASALDPQLSNEIASVSVYGNIFDTLVMMDENQNIIPHIAKSWEQIDDITTIFKLREDVTFTNGENLTAEDVVFTIERVLNSPYVAYSLDFIDRAEAIDEYTVAVYTQEPFGPILAHFTIPYTGIVPKSEVQKDEAAFSAHPVGSGAYELIEWKPGDHVTLKANEEYFLGAPAVKDVTIKIMPESSQRLIALETGEVHISYDIAPNDIGKIEKNSQLKIINEESMACMFMSANLSKGGPLADKNIRKAMNYAIDKDAIIDAVAYGYGSVAAIVIPPTCVGFSDNVAPVSYDLEKAKEYMAISDYPEGFTCNLWTSDDSIRIEACNIIQNQLAQIGITVKFEILEYGALLSRLNDGEHDLLYERWTTDSCDAYYTLYGMYNSTCTAYEGNDAFYVNHEVDSLIAEARTKYDADERKAVYEKVYEIIADDAPYIMTYYPYNSVAMSLEVNGFAINPSGAHQLRLVSLQ